LGWQQLVKASLEQCQRSFGVECRDWIEAHGAQRRDVTGGDGDGGEHGSDAGEGGEIVGPDTVKQASHVAKLREILGYKLICLSDLFQSGGSAPGCNMSCRDRLQNAAFPIAATQPSFEHIQEPIHP
jgi:hypothetical protein